MALDPSFIQAYGEAIAGTEKILIDTISTRGGLLAKLIEKKRFKKSTNHTNNFRYKTLIQSGNTGGYGADMNYTQSPQRAKMAILPIAGVVAQVSLDAFYTLVSHIAAKNYSDSTISIARTEIIGGVVDLAETLRKSIWQPAGSTAYNVTYPYTLNGVTEVVKIDPAVPDNYAGIASDKYPNWNNLALIEAITVDNVLDLIDRGLTLSNIKGKPDTIIAGVNTYGLIVSALRKQNVASQYSGIYWDKDVVRFRNVEVIVDPYAPSDDIFIIDTDKLDVLYIDDSAELMRKELIGIINQSDIKNYGNGDIISNLTDERKDFTAYGVCFAPEHILAQMAIIPSANNNQLESRLAWLGNLICYDRRPHVRISNPVTPPDDPGDGGNGGSNPPDDPGDGGNGGSNPPDDPGDGGNGGSKTKKKFWI